MTSFYVLLMVCAGSAVAGQIAVNAQLHAVAGSTLWATNISFAVSMMIGLVALTCAALLGRLPSPASALWQGPWWLWVGGFGGATYVLLSIVVAHRLGAALLSAAGILGQLGATALIDHYGWLGAPVHRLSLARTAGLVLLAAGVALIRR